jgi:hypothetical protein
LVAFSVQEIHVASEKKNKNKYKISYDLLARGGSINYGKISAATIS